MVVSKELIAQLPQTVSDCHLAFKNDRAGRPADYIPALASVDPDLFAVSICTVDGAIFTAGDSDHLFSVQSVSKPFLYASALARLGESRVLEKVGVEPTGFSFNSIIRLEGGSNRADNPMVNSGAIAISGLLADASKGESVKVDHVFVPFLERDKVQVDNEIFSSEVSTGNRNYSIANLLKYHQILSGSVESALDLYFRACSTLVSARDLAIMASTLANYGVNPFTGKRALLEKHNARVLSVMSTCGLYDYSGEFAFFTGLPAKSGVSGCVIAVVPGVMGIALYSPRIDHKGSSVRALAALPYLSEKLNLHVFHPKTNLEPAKSAIEEQSSMPHQEAFKSVFQKTGSITDGIKSNYLSERLESSDSIMAAVLYTVEGEEFCLGDVETSFSIQAGINPIVFGYGLETRGLGKLLDKVGVEPSGNPFNAIFFQPDTNLPYNPMGNAGAIAVDSILPGMSTTQRFTPLLEKMRKLCDDKTIDIDQEVFELEKVNSNRNQALAYMLKHFNVINDIERPLGLYYRQCSIGVNTRQVAKMASVLANGGKCPWSSEVVFAPKIVQQVLSVMYTCGLYDYSGRFIYDAGIPAKSGISGIIYGAVPGKFGLAVYAPGVDMHGNSVRGIEFFKLFSRLAKLSIFDRLLID